MNDSAVDIAIKISAAAAEICELGTRSQLSDAAKATEVIPILGKLLTDVGRKSDPSESSAAILAGVFYLYNYDYKSVILIEFVLDVDTQRGKHLIF